MTLVIVRHAHAGNRQKWEGPDTLRPLSKRGIGQAGALVGPLSDLQPARLLSSPAIRCVQTLAPLAEALALEIEEVDELFEGREGAAKLLPDLRDETAVICTHGDVAWDLLNEFIDARDAPLPKGSAWIIDGGDAQYVPPPTR